MLAPMRNLALRSAFTVARQSTPRAAAPQTLRLLTTTRHTLTNNSQQQNEDVVQKIGLERKVRQQEDLDTMRRRLQYQMRKRGILETDLLLSTFASEHLGSLTREEMAELDTLLSNIDWDIFYWATEKTPAPKDVEQMAVFQKLKVHASKRGSKITRMPDLEEAK